MATKGSTIADALKSQLEKGQLANDSALIYRVHGGSVGNSLDESVTLRSDGKLRVTVKDELAQKPEGDRSDSINKKKNHDLWKAALASIDSMVTEDEASFLPDTLVGSISFISGNAKEVYYFDADEEACKHRKQPIPRSLKSLMKKFEKIESDCLCSNKEDGHARS